MGLKKGLDSRSFINMLEKLINDNIIVEEDNQLNNVVTLHSDIINKLGRILKEDNNNFDFNRWNKACFNGFEDVINY